MSTHAYTQEHIILVDPDDKPLGTIEKILAHEYGMLHRAFSVFIFRQKGQIWECLLQQRAKGKYHAGGLWTNTCCSHPHPGDTVVASAEKRLQFEMGMQVSLQAVGTFHYIAQFANGLTENELDHVLVGYDTADNMAFNPQEVAAIQWISITDLKEALQKNPEQFTPWLKPALEVALVKIKL